MSAKGRNLPATMIEVRKEVVAATDGKQVPWDHSALTGDFFFAPGAASPSQGTVASAPTGTSADVAALQERLRKLEEEAKTAGGRGEPGCAAHDLERVPRLHPSRRSPGSHRTSRSTTTSASTASSTATSASRTPPPAGMRASRTRAASPSSTAAARP